MQNFDLSKFLDTVPKNFELGYCGVHSTTRYPFQLHNFLQAPIRFEYLLDEGCPFKIAPMRGTMAPRSKTEFMISYHPEMAHVDLASLVLRLNDGEETKVLKISAVSKYPYLSISHTRVDFEELIVGKTLVKEVLLQNNSFVPVTFAVEKKQDDNRDNSFSLSEYKGEVPAGTSYSLKIKYVPTLVGSFSCTHYQINTVGGNSLKFECIGVARGVDVYLSAKSVHFGEVSLGNTTSRLVNVVNDTDIPACF